MAQRAIATPGSRAVPRSPLTARRRRRLAHLNAVLAARQPAGPGQPVPRGNLLPRKAVAVVVVDVRLALVGRVVGQDLHDELPCSVDGISVWTRR